MRIEKFQQQTWAHQIESYFLQRKQDLDQVVYSLLRTKDQDMAQELYFRISEGEASFAELTQQYSEGIEKRIPAQLDESMRQRLLQEKFETWVQEQIQQLPARDKVWFGIIPAQSMNTIAA